MGKSSSHTCIECGTNFVETVLGGDSSLAAIRCPHCNSPVKEEKMEEKKEKSLKEKFSDELGELFLKYNKKGVYVADLVGIMNVATFTALYVAATE